ncbi:hypothetical protein VTO42DRAFT_6507 [Malbranchea cinnamomea]
MLGTHRNSCCGVWTHKLPLLMHLSMILETSACISLPPHRALCNSHAAPFALHLASSKSGPASVPFSPALRLGTDMHSTSAVAKRLLMCELSMFFAGGNWVRKFDFAPVGALVLILTEWGFKHWALSNTSMHGVFRSDLASKSFNLLSGTDAIITYRLTYDSLFSVGNWSADSICAIDYPIAQSMPLGVLGSYLRSITVIQLAGSP